MADTKGKILIDHLPEEEGADVVFRIGRVEITITIIVVTTPIAIVIGRLSK